MGMSEGTRHYLVDKWYREELGRRAKLPELAEHAAVIEARGPYIAFSGIYDSPEAKKHRRDTDRMV